MSIQQSKSRPVSAGFKIIKRDLTVYWRGKDWGAP